MNINQRDFMLVPFPYTDFSQRKKRPVVVLSNEEGSSRFPDYLCVAVTTKNHDICSSVPVKDEDMENGYLKRPSYAISDKLMSINEEEFIKKIGELNVEKSKEIADKVRVAVEIND